MGKPKLKNNLKKGRETFKGLKGKKKLRFLWDYYKGGFFLLLAALLLVFYIGDMVYQSRQVIDLQGFFVNDEHNLFPAGELIRDYSAYAGTKKGHRVAFEDSLFVQLESGSEYHAASQSKIVAYIAAKELDFLVVPKDLAEHYSQSFVLRDLNGLIPEALRGRLADSLCHAKDGTGVQKACYLDLRGSRFLKGTPYENTDSYCFMALDSTGHGESITGFLRYAYEQN